MTLHGCPMRPKLLSTALGCFATGLLLTSSSSSLLSIISPLIFLFLDTANSFTAQGVFLCFPFCSESSSPQCPRGWLSSAGQTFLSPPGSSFASVSRWLSLLPSPKALHIIFSDFLSFIALACWVACDWALSQERRPVVVRSLTRCLARDQTRTSHP